MKNVITYVKIENLFGMYNYGLDFTNFNENQNIAILYGDNGCGKTTLIEIVYHLLTPELGKGHLTSVLGKPFSKIEIGLVDHTVVASRKDGIKGGYVVTIYKGKDEIHVLTCNPDTDGSIRHKAHETEYQDYKKILKKIGINYRLLNSERILQSEDRDETELQYFMSEKTSVLKQNPPPLSLGTLLERAMKRASKWAQTEAFKAVDQGSYSANNIYLQLLEKLGNQSEEELKTTKRDMDDLKMELTSLAEKSKSYEVLGLVPSLDIERFLEVISSSKAENLPVLFRVLNPYVESINVKLNELDQLEKVLSNFLRNLNENFLIDKKIKFSISDGFKIENRKNVELSPKYLSSGEKHLLLLLCNVLTARISANVFFIDEPEISLNVKWQRNLIKALNDCAEGTASQFIFATHSIELLSEYRQNVIKLSSTN